jgi:hypothetical protein
MLKTLLASLISKLPQVVKLQSELDSMTTHYEELQKGIIEVNTEFEKLVLSAQDEFWKKGPDDVGVLEEPLTGVTISLRSVMNKCVTDVDLK